MEFLFREVDGDVLVVSADGGLDGDTAPQFHAELEKLVESGMRKMIIDCTRLTYVSSYGLGVLLRLHKRLAGLGGDVKLAAVPGMVAAVLRVSKLDSLFSIYPDVDRARLEFRPRDA